MKLAKSIIKIIFLDGLSRMIMILFVLGLKGRIDDLSYAQLVTFISFTSVYQSVIEFGTTNLGPRYTLDKTNSKDFSSLLILRFIGFFLVLIIAVIFNREVFHYYLMWSALYVFFPDWIMRSRFKIEQWSSIWLGAVLFSAVIALYVMYSDADFSFLFILRIIPILVVSFLCMFFLRRDWILQFKSIILEKSTLVDALNFTSGALVNRLNINFGFIIASFYMTNSNIGLVGYYLVFYNAISMLKSIVSQAIFPFFIVSNRPLKLRLLVFANFLILGVILVAIFVVKYLFPFEVESVLKVDLLSKIDTRLFLIPLVFAIIFILISFFNFAYIHSKIPLKFFRRIANRNLISFIILLSFFYFYNVEWIYLSSLSICLIEFLSMIQSYYLIFCNTDFKRK